MCKYVAAPPYINIVNKDLDIFTAGIDGNQNMLSGIQVHRWVLNCAELEEQTLVPQTVLHRQIYKNLKLKLIPIK